MGQSFSNFLLGWSCCKHRQYDLGLLALQPRGNSLDNRHRERSTGHGKELVDTSKTQEVIVDQSAIGLYIEEVGRVYRQNCKYCENFYVGEGRLYCSVLCRNRDRVTPEFRKKLSVAGRKRWTPEQRKWRSDFNKTNGIRPSGFQKGHKPTPRYGKDNPNWRGGITPIHLAIRASTEYKLWRKAVYERDNYTCVECGTIGNGKNLNADHIKPFATYPELRLVLSNGRTLCVDCHKKTPIYGRPRK